MKPYLYLQLFGYPRFTYQNQPISNFVSDKARALLIYLAMTRQAHNREHLAELLWANKPNTRRENLKKALHNLRNLEGITLIEEGHQRVTLDMDYCRVDVTEFEEHVANATALVHTSHKNREGLQRAIQLYQADFLADFNTSLSYEFESWALSQRVRLKEQMITTLEQLAADHWQRQEFSEAIAAIRQLLPLEPWREESHRQLMEMLAQTGQKHSALAQYEACRQLLEQELGAPPSPLTVELYRKIRDGIYERSPNDGGIGWQSDAESPIADTPVPASTKRLFGIDAALNELLGRLCTMDRPWLVAIDGIGGIGKTTLAQAIVNVLQSTDRFNKVVWVSAKQLSFHPEQGMQSVDGSTSEIDGSAIVADKSASSESAADESNTAKYDMKAEEMLNELFVRLVADSMAVPLPTKEEKEATLRRILQEQPTLVVIDNLETVADYEALLPMLRRLTNPSKVLITSRYALYQHMDVFGLTLGELSQADAFELLRYEATMRGIRSLENSSDDALARIYAVVGGHPLALNLVLGQLSFLPLPHVLESLQQATGQRVDELYTYIYWRSWETLATPSRKLFLAMPVLVNATYAQLAAVTKLNVDELQNALAQLIGLSLVQVAGDLLEPRYRLHRLTGTFLLNEVVKWESR